MAADANAANSNRYKLVLLSDSPQNAAIGDSIGAYVSPVPREHHGCGTQAAQNMLAYYGDQLPIRDRGRLLPPVRARASFHCRTGV